MNKDIENHYEELSNKLKNLNGLKKLTTNLSEEITEHLDSEIRDWIDTWLFQDMDSRVLDSFHNWVNKEVAEKTVKHEEYKSRLWNKYHSLPENGYISKKDFCKLLGE